MQSETIEGRLERLEMRMTELEHVSGRVDALAEPFAHVTTPVSPVTTGVAAASSRIEHVLARLDELRDEVRCEIRGGDEDTRRFIRDLHEDLIRRIAALSAGGK